MMRFRSHPRGLGADDRAATLVEFGFVAPVLCLTLMGLFDLGYQSYVTSIMQGALHEAARMATIGNKTGAQIDAHVKARLRSFSNGATITAVPTSYDEFSSVKMAEKITGDTAPVGSYNRGDCFLDANRNGSYDLDRGKSGLGASEDIVNYEVTITYQRLFPLSGLLGVPKTQTIKQSTVLRNQPYASRTAAQAPICPA